ncbi:MAG TPA: UDP-N-acetylglucosamine 1-carboxyvinyltransferase [Thiomonas arsenitoxydans]|jgi:UDP-N-acetylglucosamine 1-carboxyvinyltransferase|uniref:UDP-N-acetylglucosamine 1-carboxyvinyltransferase n=1 Tax=Thiomonas intermedia (strain K12) TaxID=75379 RepID=D5WYE6_THIK1|nr:UDP-N-acetylglucosamine 1-carboxyvinyltransferase [Thiomonas sp.]OZB73380.1 MAG: UDP-N-acetylglucosamine 1-carboxyvinyltransferase [Thiomonas sp. 14-64-326]HOI66629.1 UDP-N-acetylglucosamine 1-carboxyvinyltransferase [Thiomonas arsenitoxydans]
MDKLRITGQRTLQGVVQASGAKNAALPLIAAALLTAETVQLSNAPQLMDVRTLAKLLRSLGAQVEQDGGQIRLSAAAVNHYEASYELVKTMRASVLVLGPLLARFGQARVSLPGGCAIGARPVDQHIKGLQALGADIAVEHGYIVARVATPSSRLRGARITTDMVTVTGTENLMMAATLAEGETLIDNAAREPEIVDLANLLRAMGAQIRGDGTSQIRIQGVGALHGASHRIIPDRIEVGTFLCAALAARGDVTVQGAEPAHQDALLDKLREAGAQIDTGADWIRLRADALPGGRPRAVSVRTTEYPGFATDMQAQFMAVNCLAEGAARMTETIFENRFMHVQELMRLGAQIDIDGHTCVVHGVPQLSGATVMATDLRASAGLVVAALAAEGETVIDRIYHLDRGYDAMEVKLRGLGAQIERISDRISGK